MASEKRTSARARGYTWRWEKARTSHLRHEPLCRMCSAQGRITAATVVDHLIPHKGNLILFWDPENWQSLCPDCHTRHKQREEYRGYSTAIGPDGWPLDERHPANIRR
jgi:5-methylcytosine-specific restriction protein A